MLALVVALSACTAIDDFGKFHIADLSTQPRDLAPARLPDLYSPPDLAPPVPRYQPDIQRILDRRGCTAGVCHQAYAPLVEPEPPLPAELTDAQWAQNYVNVAATVTACDMSPSRACSPLLEKPLANGPPHAGGVTFLSTSDPDYQTLLRWANSGAPRL